MQKKALKLSGAAVGVLMITAALIWSRRGNNLNVKMSEHHKAKEIQMFTLAEARIFCNSNTKKLNRNNHRRCRCGDGRYFGSPTLASLARFGADAGYFAVILAAMNDLKLSGNKSPLTETEARAILRIVIEEMGGPTAVCIHTDDSHGPNICSGCGFLNQIRQHPINYHLNSMLVSLIDSTLAELKGSGAHEEKLQGDHLERAVIIVKGGDIHLVPRNESGDEVFVYTEDLDRIELERFAEILAKVTGFTKAVLSETFVQVSDLQTELTRVALADDRPVYVLSGKVEDLHLTQRQ